MNDSIERMICELSLWKNEYDRRAGVMCDAFLGRGDGKPLLLLSSGHAMQREIAGYNPKDIHFDSDKMLQNELRAALSVQVAGSAAVPSVRANMGCGIVPALFGVLPELFEDKMPWVQKHLTKEEISDMTVADIKITPEFRQALDHMEYFTQVLRGSGVRVYPVDIQGAFDTAHIVYGDDIFYQIYDDPEFVHHLLKLSTAAALLAFDECTKRIDGSDDMVAHYNALVMPASNGAIKLSEDTSTLISKAQIEEFVMPYIREIFDATGGGYIHYCGYNEHLYDAVIDESRAWAFNFGNPDKHDMEAVLRDMALREQFYYGPIPEKKGEARSDYFSRLIEASVMENGKSNLMLCYICRPEDAETVVAEFNRAAQIINV